jgi:hypothetical protein
MLLDEAGGPAFLWTQKALLRHGFAVITGQAVTDYLAANPSAISGASGRPMPCTVRITEEGGRTIWLVEYSDRMQQYETISALLEALNTLKALDF